MSLTKFGAEVRQYRRTLGVTLSAMAAELRTSPAFLSAMETGRNKVPMEWVAKIADYFSERGIAHDASKLKVLACEANESVSLEGLPPHHKMLIAGFANSNFNQEQLARFGKLLEDIYSENKVPKDDSEH
ncbi:helix-turn-helix domain-containing protein [Stutzerimonas stutzeri]|uniref:helix-turn-helix domain-containing protein n=1 Tax=Stutzerimonas stutzeri TaxID=316 RepID=UPI000D0AE40D|nr:helix-turn-helix transcriptional regulator [Stutzerimonas stutzeri]AWK98639.1 XRE family transcriptional regulator [Stutzerimonas stutzeri]